MRELVKLSKISPFTAKQHCLQPLYKCTRVEGGRQSADLRSDQAFLLPNQELGGFFLSVKKFSWDCFWSKVILNLSKSLPCTKFKQ